MAHRELSAKDLEEIRELAQRWGKIVARHAFGEDGPGTEVDLDTMEQVARMAAAGLTEGTLGTLLEQQAHRLGTQQPCPACGRHWTVVTRDSLPSVHVEHTLALTRDGVYVVTADEETLIPRR